MDSTDPEIVFDENGICNHCKTMSRILENFDNLTKNELLDKTIKKIKNAGKDKKYDCIIGVSGGVDSSYIAILVKKFGLRPLAVHLDNGWNSELAVKNIENLLRKINIELYTYVLNWEEFKDIQLSFLKASVPDLEIPTDHAINAILYKVAADEKIKNIIIGTNYASEAIMPKSWSRGHYDWGYIKKLYGLFGTKKIKTFVHFTLLNLFVNKRIKRINKISLLNLIDYNKQNAKETLMNEYGWRDYGGKHYESIYTKFYQGYILPLKFGFDKRKAHLSTLINSKQITRGDALNLLNDIPYKKEEIDCAKTYVAKKLGISIIEFENLLTLPNKKYSDYRPFEWMDTAQLENAFSSVLLTIGKTLRFIRK